MDTSSFWLLIALPWLAIGLIIGVAMGRAGHHLPVWLALGIAWGPFAVPLAVGAHRREAGERRRVIDPGRWYDGPVDLLLGVDGSPESIAAMEQATALLGPQVGRLRVLRVIDRDTGSSDDRPELEPILIELRATVATHLPDLRPEIVVTTGVPSRVISEMAETESFELVAVGTRGHGLSEAVLGSTAEALVHHCRVPVVVVRPALRRSEEPSHVLDGGAAAPGGR